ncbi:hypothetical protein DERF_006221 [Dermatophagoides farinae]|uniref:Uncharacterized protein n=1 Tax=Dermatophagoides farinae TaxID=6954 RepID=A0A922LBZ6_DERFA|nr:hypothetical protein DERF_006221 [Dermatophagoides farinae]
MNNVDNFVKLLHTNTSTESKSKCVMSQIVVVDGDDDSIGLQPVAFGPNLYTNRRPNTGSNTCDL